MLAQESEYWGMRARGVHNDGAGIEGRGPIARYLGSKSYRMTLTLRRAEIEILEGSGLSASTLDPYVGGC